MKAVCCKRQGRDEKLEEWSAQFVELAVQSLSTREKDEMAFYPCIEVMMHRRLEKSERNHLGAMISEELAKRIPELVPYKVCMHTNLARKWVFTRPKLWAQISYHNADLSIARVKSFCRKHPENGNAKSLLKMPDDMDIREFIDYNTIVCYALVAKNCARASPQQASSSPLQS